MPGANIAYSQWSRMWLFEAFFTAFRSVLSDSDETRIAPLAICVPLPTIIKNRHDHKTDTNISLDFDFDLCTN